MILVENDHGVALISGENENVRVGIEGAEGRFGEVGLLKEGGVKF